MTLTTASARLWVDHYLDTYCLPGDHRFAWASPTRRWCTICYKEESPAQPSCLICDAAGEVAGKVAHDGAIAAQGTLCADCATGVASSRMLNFYPN